MFSKCKVSVIGRLTGDPRTGEANGKYYANCRVAADVGFGEKKTSSFINFTLWDKLAEAVGPKLQKGDKVAVDGDLILEEYEGKDGKKSSLQIRFVDTFILLEDTRDRADTGERPRGRDGSEFGKSDEFNPPRESGGSPFGRGGRR